MFAREHFHLIEIDYSVKTKTSMEAENTGTQGQKKGQFSLP